MRFAGRLVEFVDRDAAIEQLMRLAERGVYKPLIIYGPEGCGKTALLKQAGTILEERGYHVVYVNPLANTLGEAIQYTASIRDVVKEILRALPDPTHRIVDAAINIANLIIKRFSRPRVALLLDDVFQAIGLDRAERLVKALLNLVEYPPGDYDRIVVLVSSSEGLTRERVGRHRWSSMRVMWNMARRGFSQLYDALPGDKPRLEEVWLLTGGNPDVLRSLYEESWRFRDMARELATAKGLTRGFVERWRRDLEEAVEDPDHLWYASEELARELVEKNLIVYHLPPRDPVHWVDEPPPEKDLELGIGRYVAWQTPLHREAVRVALTRY